MPGEFLHGVEVVTIDNGARPIQTVRSAVIGLIGTAPDATSAFPLDTPVLVTSARDFAGIGATGTLPDALAGIFDQAGAVVVVIRVAAGANEAATMVNIIGGVDGVTGARKGMQAFRDSQMTVGVTPMILIAPGFTSTRPTGVTSVTVGNQGSGYTSAPTVTFSGGGTNPAKILPTGVAVLGSGATAGKVVSVTLTDKGQNLDSAPTIAFSGGGGTGAAATATTGTYANPVVASLLGVATAIRAHIIAEGPSTTDAAALAYAQDFGSRRIYVVDPSVMVYDSGTAQYVAKPASPRVAGLIARIDAQRGFWWSPSNQEIAGIGGTSRPIDYALGDTTARANILNEGKVATIIRDEGYRLWGNRTLSSDPIWAFLSVSRTADMIDLSIQRGHRWAVDRPISKNYFDDVTESVNGYLRQLQALGAILGGKCWVDPDFNTPADISAGKVTFSYDFTPPAPAERVTFRSTITDTYVANLFANS